MIVNAGDRIAFGLVGAGAIGKAYIQAFEACETARLVAIADIDPRACREAATRANCIAADDMRALADIGNLDAVLVCTPPVTHAKIATFFLRHGVNVLCEKPLALDLAAAHMMLETSQRTGAVLTMASKFRYVDDISRARSIAASGVIGDVVLFENVFTSHVDMKHRWNSDPDVSGGGVLIDNGTHSVDLMRYFLGSIAAVQAVEGRRIQDLAVEDTVRLHVRSTTGVMGSIDLSWSIQKDHDEYVSLYGTRGTIHVGWRESKFRLQGEPEWTVFGHGYQKIQALAKQIDNFARALHGEETLLITADDALASVAVVSAAYDALRRDRWISVHVAPAPPSAHPPLAQAAGA